jgi:hypothetical protein
MRILTAHRSTIVALLIICFGIAVRLLRLDIPFDPEDVHLDYLVGHHIVRYGEVPWSGSGNPLLIDSPLYYYIVAFFVWIYDHLLFLAVVNVVFIQGVTFFLLYRLGTELFDKKVGLLAVFLAVCSFEYLAEGAYFFQTHVMQVFVNVAFLFLVRAYKRKAVSNAYWSACLFVIALSVHHSILALTPLYVLLLFFAMPDARRRWRQFGICMASMMGVLFVLHTPVFFLFSDQRFIVGNIIQALSTGHVLAPVEVAKKFVYNLAQFFNAFSLRWVSHAWIVNSVAACLLVGSVWWHQRVQPREKKIPMWLTALAIVQFVLIASFLTQGVWNFTFSSLFGVYIVMVAACIRVWFVWPAQWTRVAAVGGILFVLYVFSNGFIFLDALNYPRLVRWSITQESASVIQKKVGDLKEANGFSDALFFQIQRVHKQPTGGFFVDVYTHRDIQIIEDLLYWPLLQNALGTQFIRVEKNGSFPTVLSEATYIFVICDSTRNEFMDIRDCLDRYRAHYPEYEFVEHLYVNYPISIMLVRKVNNGL